MAAQNSIRFILDGDLVEISDVDPTRTVLQYLREDLGKVGSKEGCAEGDCGACTVVVGETVNNRLQFRAVNACIQFLPTLDGKILYTVESLKPAGGVLHPVQQSMVDYHGSQCGFCTPGFIMSMFALYKSEANIDRANIDDALSGNLCRCTGYRPIVEAAFNMSNYPISETADPVIYQPAGNDTDTASAPEQELIDRLQQLKRSKGLELVVADKQYFAPASTDELARFYQDNPDACILSGGTDVGLWVTKQLRELPTVIYLGNIGELDKITMSESEIEIGAAVSLSDAFAALSPEYPEFDEMFRRFASVPVRNAGTLVGNIANGSPIGDSMPALISIDARVKLRKGSDTRELPMQELYLDYMKNAMQAGEFIESVIVPKRDESLQLRCYKLCKRFDQDISAVCAAFALRLDGDQVASISIVLGGMAAIPSAASKTEKQLLGKAWTEETVVVAMESLKQDFTPMSDMRASAAYRQQASSNLLYRFYLETRPQSALQSGQVNVFAVSA